MDYDTALFAKAQEGCKSIRTADNTLQDSFHYLQFGSKYDHLRHANVNKSPAI